MKRVVIHFQNSFKILTLQYQKSGGEKEKEVRRRGEGGGEREEEEVGRRATFTCTCMPKCSPYFKVISLNLYLKLCIF